MANEARILANPGEEINIGGKVITLKDMPWARANEFENNIKATIKELFVNKALELKDLQNSENQDETFQKLMDLLEMILQHKPVELVLIAVPELTEEHITMNCSKNEVFSLLMLLVENNYKTVKNLLSLISKTLR